MNSHSARVRNASATEEAQFQQSLSVESRRYTRLTTEELLEWQTFLLPTAALHLSLPLLLAVGAAPVLCMVLFICWLHNVILAMVIMHWFAMLVVPLLYMSVIERSFEYYQHIWAIHRCLFRIQWKVGVLLYVLTAATMYTVYELLRILNGSFVDDVVSKARGNFLAAGLAMPLPMLLLVGLYFFSVNPVIEEWFWRVFLYREFGGAIFISAENDGVFTLRGSDAFLFNRCVPSAISVTDLLTLRIPSCLTSPLSCAAAGMQVECGNSGFAATSNAACCCCFNSASGEVPAIGPPAVLLNARSESCTSLIEAGFSPIDAATDSPISIAAVLPGSAPVTTSDVTPPAADAIAFNDAANRTAKNGGTASEPAASDTKAIRGNHRHRDDIIQLKPYVQPDSSNFAVSIVDAAPNEVDDSITGQRLPKNNVTPLADDTQQHEIMDRSASINETPLLGERNICSKKADESGCPAVLPPPDAPVVTQVGPGVLQVDLRLSLFGQVMLSLCYASYHTVVFGNILGFTYGCIALPCIALLGMAFIALRNSRHFGLLGGVLFHAGVDMGAVIIIGSVLQFYP